MNKSETIVLLIPYLESLLVQLGYRYLKSHEKFICRCEDGKKWIVANVTYWPSSNYCMFSPRMGVHFDRLEKFKSQYLGDKPDPHCPTLHMLSDNMEGGGFWSFHSTQDLEDYKSEIENKMTNLYLPYVDKLSSIANAASMVLDRSYDNFMNEYDRLIFLFSYVGAYHATEIVERTVESFDPSRKSKNQMVPYHKQQLQMLKAGVPEIGMIDIQ